MEAEARKAVESEDTACVYIAVALVNMDKHADFLHLLVWTGFPHVGSSFCAADGMSNILSVVAFQEFLQGVVSAVRYSGTVKASGGILESIPLLLSFPCSFLAIPLEVSFLKGPQVKFEFQINYKF